MTKVPNGFLDHMDQYFIGILHIWICNNDGKLNKLHIACSDIIMANDIINIL